MTQAMPARALNSGLRLVVLWLIAVCTITPSYAADASAPAHIQKELTPAYLSGLGSFRWFGLKIYDAQLWVGDKGFNSNTPDNHKFALDLRYARTLQGRKIAEASRDEIQKLGLGNEQQLTEWQSRMEQIFPDVSEGMHLTGIYLPQIGARFYLDGKAIGEIKDAAFAQAFFALWLSPKTTAPQLRNALLAGAAPR
jgi:hypothetical protein